MSRGRYRFGLPAAQLAAQVFFHSPRADCSSGPLRRLRQSSDQGLAFFYGLTYFGGARRECIDMAVGDSDLSELGMSPRQVMAANQCLRLSTSGRVLLAHLPDVFREQILSLPLPAEGGPGVYRDNERLRASLDRVRAQGYAIGREECARGWDSYASPVRWGNVVVGAVALLTPTHPAPTSATVEHLVTAVRAAAAEIGSRLSQLSSDHRSAGTDAFRLYPRAGVRETAAQKDPARV
ncbi:IclR family transcriptional regulator C-terminal domain-containing protein [Streptomyces griseoloalbus]|uniref:IclR family transcriptional regulator domain-containing protein n=1 Tax=Streptomyces griseoloalbus TaxID=67303 RepID=UPI0033A01056